MCESFQKPNSSGDLSSYAKRLDLKYTAGVATSDFAKKSDLANLKSYVDKLDIEKFLKWAK